MRAWGLLVVSACRLGFDPVTNGSGPDAAAPDGGPMATIQIAVTGAGAGQVIVKVDGVPIACAAACEVPIGAKVLFLATPAAGAWFRGWTSGCGGRRACEVVVDAGLSVTADFTPEPNRIFISSGVHDALLLTGGAGDAFCNQQAAGAGLSGTYKVLVSTAGASWATRVGGARGWIRVDGQPVTDDLLAIDGRTIAAISLTESGAPISTAEKFWATHHNVGGNPFCNDWTTNNVAQTGIAIDSLRGSNYNNGGGSQTCDVPAHVICAQSDRVVPVLPVPDPGRRAFTTKGAFDPMTGRAMADTLCATEATAAGLSGTFLAMLPLPGESALARFDLAGEPWVRPDGIPFLQSAAAWKTAGVLDATPHVAADGTLISYQVILTGAIDPATPGTLATTCNGWTANTTAAFPMFTWETLIRTPNGTGGCSPLRVVCLEN